MPLRVSTPTWLVSLSIVTFTDSPLRPKSILSHPETGRACTPTRNAQMDQCKSIAKSFHHDAANPTRYITETLKLPMRNAKLHTCDFPDTADYSFHKTAPFSLRAATLNLPSEQGQPSLAQAIAKVSYTSLNIVPIWDVHHPQLPRKQIWLPVTREWVVPGGPNG